MANRKQQKRRYTRAREHARRSAPEQDRAGPEPKRRPAATDPRAPKPPSIRRALKRGGVFGVLFFAFVLLVPLGGERPTPIAAAVQSLAILLWLVPLGYLLDSFMYKRWAKRQG